jgi:hypothetical protein
MSGATTKPIVGSDEQRAISAGVPDGSVMRIPRSLAPVGLDAAPWPDLDLNLVADGPLTDTIQ